MGKKSKKKIQWRKLSLNELGNNSLSDDECDDKTSENINSQSPTPSSDSRSRSCFIRRSFHHSRDQYRYPHNHPPPHHNNNTLHQQQHNLNQNEVLLERAISGERCPSKGFNRPFYVESRTHFPSGQRRRPFKNFGNKGGYTQGHSPSLGDQLPRRRWSEDDSLTLEDAKEEEIEEVADDDRPSQPVHTVFIDNEEYTKIQTPRQEVIFKKSSLDRKRDSVDLGSPPSTCGSVTGCELSTQGDQASLSGSIEEPVLSREDEPQCDEMQENRPYEDTNNIFVGEPGRPPLAGVVMQEAFPGGPLISIPVHWTPFLDPGLIPGDTALTPLDPSFTHIIDPKDLPVDPSHILPVQHDSNGCPVTVQVKVNANGQPVEIEPSAFTVSLSTLDPHQQEVILRKSTDVLTNSHIPSETQTRLYEKEQLEEVKAVNHAYCSSEKHKHIQTDTNKISNEITPEQIDDCSPDSQYATMSEDSTAPTTPSGELSDNTELATESKSNSEKSTLDSYTKTNNKLSRLDSLLETEPSEDDYYEDIDIISFKSSKSVAEVNSKCFHERNCNYFSTENNSLGSCVSSVKSESSIVNQALPNDSSKDQLKKSKISDGVETESLCCKKIDKTCVESFTSKDNMNKNKRKVRCSSLDSTVSSQNSIGDVHGNESESVEPLSKYQVKKHARKLKKEKKRLNKEKNKARINSSSVLKFESCTEKENKNFGSSKISEKSSKNCEVVQEMSVDTKLSPIAVNGCGEVENKFSDNNKNSIATENLEDVELKPELPSVIDNTESESSSVENCVEKVVGNETDSIDNKISSKSLSTRKDSENFVLKQGFVMVPILTPYYDPAVLYGYPVIVPESPPERNYTASTNNSNKKKKKKFKKRYHEGNYLDTELYAGEPFVATPNGYVVPVDASHLCQLHGYQYIPTVFPHIMPDEGFILDHSPYLYEYFHESSYRKLNSFGEREKKYRYTRYYEDPRKKAAEAQQPGENNPSLPKDLTESCDSGVSESEEVAQLNLAKGTNEVYEDTNNKEDSFKKSKDKKSSLNIAKETDQKQSHESIKTKKSKKKKKNRKKSKKDIIEILEPDFSSFNSPTLRFEVSKNEENWKAKQNKNLKSRKKILNDDSEDTKSGISDLFPSFNKSKKSENSFKNDFLAKTSEQKVVSTIPSPTDQSIRESSKVSTKETKKVQKVKNKKKLQKLEKKNFQTLEEKALFFTESSSKLERPANCSRIKDDQNITSSVPELPQNEEIALHETSEARNEENFNFVSSTIENDILSQESGIGVESEESLNYNDSYDTSVLSQEEEELNLNESETVERRDENKIFQELKDKHNPESFDETSSQIVNNYSLENKEVISISEKSDDLQDSLPIQIKDFTNVENISTNEMGLDSLYSITSNYMTPDEPVSNSEVCLNNVSDSVLSIKIDLDCEILSKDMKLMSPLPPVHENQILSFKDLGVTEAVKRWIREVTPEKAFGITDETRSMIFTQSKELLESESEEVSDFEERNVLKNEYQPKNVLSNPFVASPSECSLDTSGERVASLASSATKRTKDNNTLQKVYSHISQNVDSFDGEIFRIYDRESLYSSSSCSSFSTCTFPEDSSTLLDDPRVCDPSVYLKYYQLGADIQIPHSNSPTRESTLSPSFVGSDDVDLRSETVSVPIELFKSEKRKENMAHISPSFCKDGLPLPHCGSTASCLDMNSEINFNLKTEGEVEITGADNSESSSGIGSSLASTPHASPHHQFLSQPTNSYSKPKLEPHPLVNLSASEGPLPCRTMCCSIM